MNAKNLQRLIGHLEVAVELIKIAVDQADVEAIFRYTNLAGGLLNKINQTVVKR